MKHKFLFKALFAFVLTLAVVFGSGVVMEKTGVALATPAYACSSPGGGGC